VRGRSQTLCSRSPRSRQYAEVLRWPGTAAGQSTIRAANPGFSKAAPGKPDPGVRVTSRAACIFASAARGSACHPVPPRRRNSGAADLPACSAPRSGAKLEALRRSRRTQLEMFSASSRWRFSNGRSPRAKVGCRRRIDCRWARQALRRTSYLSECRLTTFATQSRIASTLCAAQPSPYVSRLLRDPGRSWDPSRERCLRPPTGSGRPRPDTSVFIDPNTIGTLMNS